MRLDVIVTSTCRKTIEKTLDSFRENISYSRGFRFIVNVDVKNPGYLPSLLKFLDHSGIKDVHINRHPLQELRGHTQAINFLYGQLQSPYYFNLEDDWIFLKKVELDRLIDLMDKQDIIDIIKFNKIRLPKDAWLYHLSPAYAPVTKLNHNVTLQNINLVKTHTWSFNPSLARTATIKAMLPVPLDYGNPEIFICHRYDQLFSSRGAYFLGQIDNSAIIKDLGRSKWVAGKIFLKRKLMESPFLRFAYGDNNN